MLTKLRQQTKFWMWIVAGAFILTIVFAWGMDYSGGGSSPVLGKVNGYKIMIQDYQNLLQRNYDAQRQQLGGRELDEAFVEFIQEQTWQEMVNQILIGQELNKLGLAATDNEVVFVLRNNPPPVVRNIGDFQTDGIFDMQKYQSAMSSEAYRMFWVDLEAMMRNYLPQLKLQHLIGSTSLVTDSEALESYRYRNERVSAQFVKLDPISHPDSTITVSRNEIETYYRAHQDMFAEPEKVDLNYVLLYKEASPRDLEEVQEDIGTVMSRLENGEDFSNLARLYSDDTSADQGGDLGWVSPGDMVVPFNDAAFILEENSISEPVLSEFGWHIIKCDSIRDAGTDSEQRQLSHILFKEEPSSTTLDSLEALLDDLRAAAVEEDFNTAAQRLGLEVQVTGPVAKGGFVPGLGFETKALNFGFANRIGTVSDLMEHMSAYYVIQVRDKIEAGIASLDDVIEQIRDDLIFEKTLAALKPLGERIALQMQEQPARFAAIAEAESLNVEEATSFSRNDYVTGVGRDPTFIAAAFALPLGEVSNLVQGSDFWYIIKVTEHTELAEEGLQTLIESEKERLLNSRIQAAYSEWVRGLRNSAKIVDNRTNFFY